MSFRIPDAILLSLPAASLRTLPSPFPIYFVCLDCSLPFPGVVTRILSKKVSNFLICDGFYSMMPDLCCLPVQESEPGQENAFGVRDNSAFGRLVKRSCIDGAVV